MGTEQSKENKQETYEQLIKKYELVEKIPGDIQILKEKGTDKLLAMKEFNLTDENQFLKVYNKFQPKLQLDHMNIIKLYSNILLFFIPISIN